ncbi:MAG: hypothetical protein ACKOPQ_06670 [Novosphingobium sp.]
MLSQVLDDDVVRWFLMPGLAALAVALFGWWRDHRRRHRTDPDAVGVVDWTTLSFWSLLVAFVLLGAALKSWLHP